MCGQRGVETSSSAAVMPASAIPARFDTTTEVGPMAFSVADNASLWKQCLSALSQLYLSFISSASSQLHLSFISALSKLYRSVIAARTLRLFPEPPPSGFVTTKKTPKPSSSHCVSARCSSCLLPLWYLAGDLFRDQVRTAIKYQVRTIKYQVRMAIEYFGGKKSG